MTGVTIVQHVRARPAIVFEAMTTAEGIRHWWGPGEGPVLVAEAEPRLGGRFRVRFRMLGGSEHESYGVFLEFVPHERFAMSWRWVGGLEDPGESRVEVVLRAVADGTEVTFTHSRLEDDNTARSHEEGWRGALSKLARYCAAQ
jgi:uncharacterized protein YndB with AHSA1/START domain